MDLNERLAARRKELADEADRARREADRLRQAELEAAHQAAQAKAVIETLIKVELNAFGTPGTRQPKT